MTKLRHTWSACCLLTLSALGLTSSIAEDMAIGFQVFAALFGLGTLPSLDLSVNLHEMCHIRLGESEGHLTPRILLCAACIDRGSGARMKGWI